MDVNFSDHNAYPKMKMNHGVDLVCVFSIIFSLMHVYICLFNYVIMFAETMDADRDYKKN
jgi:hypothetical protein